VAEKLNLIQEERDVLLGIFENVLENSTYMEGAEANIFDNEMTVNEKQYRIGSVNNLSLF
jgi:uncharacterized protein YkvS